jgi:hypothetical protein
MSTPAGHVPTTNVPPSSTTRKRRPWLLPAIAGVAGLAVGVAAGGGTADPTKSPEYAAARSDLTAARQELTALAAERDHAVHDVKVLTDRAAAVQEQAAEVAERETAVAAREAAITTTEQAVAASTIKQGTWTVGVDIEPGTYRTTAPVAGECYWAIYTSGTNKDDIIQNDIVKGGQPTVTLAAGQDFETNRCGDWVRQ